ncbi:hypothetical protein [Haloferula sp.]|uniref:hypothetical protein n=1 Tax=Haloferula sp. TaxID=2497595 RepID=UPI003C7696F3
MRASILLIVGIVLFVVLAIGSAIYLKRHYDEQKEELLDTLPKIPSPDGPSEVTPSF